MNFFLIFFNFFFQNFHPSVILEQWIYGGDVNKLSEGLTVPQLLLSAGNDPEFEREGGSIEKILQAKPFASACKVKVSPALFLSSM